MNFIKLTWKLPTYIDAVLLTLKEKIELVQPTLFLICSFPGIYIVLLDQRNG
jgi:hypothetical protein